MTPNKIISTFMLVILATGASRGYVPNRTFDKSDRGAVAKLYVHNMNNKTLGVLIKPKIIDPRLLQELPAVYRVTPYGELTASMVSLDLSNCSFCEVNVYQSDLGNPSEFSITGETSAVTPIGKCSNLQFGKQYYIWFTNNHLGTDCVSLEVKTNLILPLYQGVVTPKKVLWPISKGDSDLPERPSELTPILPFFGWFL